MVLDFSKASKKQLFHIAYHEDCPFVYKYKALFEIRNRNEKEISRSVSRLKRRAAYTDKSYKLNY